MSDLAAAGELLSHYIKRERIPAVVRRAIPVLNGLSLLDLLEQGRTDELLDTCRGMFDFEGERMRETAASTEYDGAMPNPIVFIDFAGPDDETLGSFYASVFGWEADESGQFSPPVVTPMSCAVRKDPAEKRVYVGVPDVTACLSLIEQLGGSIDAPRFEVPGVVVLGLFRDPASNPMGLVEMDGDLPRVP